MTSDIKNKRPLISDAQLRTLELYIQDGWLWTSQGSNSSENIEKDGALFYIRTDGLLRPQ
jgi:hypothetical protein